MKAFNLKTIKATSAVAIALSLSLLLLPFHAVPECILPLFLYREYCSMQKTGQLE